MGIWDSIFGNTKEESSNQREPINWSELSSGDALRSLIESSYNQPQLIFKHSRTCGASGMTKRRFEADAARFRDQFAFHLLIVQKNRDLSGQVAVQFQVKHESPQLLIVKDGMVASHASHWHIDSLDLGSFQ